MRLRPRPPELEGFPKQPKGNLIILGLFILLLVVSIIWLMDPVLPLHPK
ncbi:MAG TPA: hypothetical protein VMH89_11360 [Candidatus Acidoferrum sp.]|nr:hypothetical protein [Candidatus Acidoferrum sp.]